MYKYQISLIQILSSIFLLFLSNFLIQYLLIYNPSITITYTFITFLTASILFYFNRDLLTSHYKRFRTLEDQKLFYLIGTIAFTVFLLVNKYFLNAYIYLINPESIIDFPIYGLNFILAFTFINAFIYAIVFRLSVKIIKIKNNELLVIILSGIIYGILYSATLLPISIFEFITNFIFYFMISLCFSYFYNQSNNIFNPALAYGSGLLIINLINILL